MKLVLKGFAEEVDLATKVVKNILVFISDDGKELRLPVGSETVDVLMEFTFGKEPDESPAAPAAEPQSAMGVELSAGATEFGDDDQGQGDNGEGDDFTDDDDDQGGGPRSEDEVPSL